MSLDNRTSRALPDDPVRRSARACTVLLEDDQVLIEHFRRSAVPDTLVITFDPLQHLSTRPPFGHEFLNKQSLDVVAVRKKSEHFYQALDRPAFEAAVLPVAAQYRRVVSYGSSLGAYAALYFGRDQPWTLIASSPRNSTHPVYGSPTWQGRVAFRHQPFDPAVTPRCEAIIIYDPRDAIDRRYLEGEVLPQFGAAQVLRVPWSGHPSNQVLAEIGFIAPFVRAVLADLPRAQWPRLERRAGRARSPSYLQNLALLCLQRGHLRWADELAARALALSPRGMLVQRTHGMVRLAQQRWDEAAESLQGALAAAPHDPLTAALLRQARNAGVDPLAEPPPRVPLWRRLLRRARRLLGWKRPADRGIVRP